jgi:hypothetical protein
LRKEACRQANDMKPNIFQALTDQVCAKDMNVPRKGFHLGEQSPASHRMCEPFLIAGLQLEKSLREAHAKPAVRPVYNGAEGETRSRLLALLALGSRPRLRRRPQAGARRLPAFESLRMYKTLTRFDVNIGTKITFPVSVKSSLETEQIFCIFFSWNNPGVTRLLIYREWPAL